MPARTLRIRSIPGAALLLIVTALVSLVGGPGQSVSGDPRPILTHLSVTSGPTAGGTTVKITGKHLTKVKSVLFGSSPAPKVEVRSARSIKVTTPAHAAGTVHVKVVTKHGTTKAVKAGRFQFKDTDWVGTALPRPADADGSPTARQSACWAVRHCVITGSYRQKSGNDAAVVWTLNGTKWSVARVPLPSDAAENPDPFPIGLECDTTGVCAGYALYTAHRDGRDVQETYVLWARSADGTWSAVVPPLPATSTSDALIVDVACGKKVCVARGNDGFVRPVLWTLAEGTWSVTAAPLPAGARTDPYGGVAAVACSQDGDCVANGDYLDVSHGLSLQRVLWRLTGSGWVATEAPLPAGTTMPSNGSSSYANDAACSPDTCLATFTVLKDSFPTRVVTVLWALENGTWSHEALPLPAGAEPATGHLSALTCSPSGQCAAVGQYADTAGDQQGALWVRSAADQWTVTRAELPGDTAQNPMATVRRVACDSDGACVATGSYVFHAGGADHDDEYAYDRLQWTYLDGHWVLLARTGNIELAGLGSLVLSCGSDFCVRFDGYHTLWTLTEGRWRRDRAEVAQGGLAHGVPALAIRTDVSSADKPAWVYVG